MTKNLVGTSKKKLSWKKGGWFGRNPISYDGGSTELDNKTLKSIGGSLRAGGPVESVRAARAKALGRPGRKR